MNGQVKIRTLYAVGNANLPIGIRRGKMAEIGEIQQGTELGWKTLNKRIWVACEDCSKERWAMLNVKEGMPKNRLCKSCSHMGYSPTERVRRNQSETMKGKFERGAKSRNWKGGIRPDGRGYIRILLLPDDFFYPMADHHHYVLEHRLVMAKKLGRCLQHWEMVHHKGIRYNDIRNKSDNLEDNLEMTTNGAHVRDHSKGYRDGYTKGLTDGRLKQIQELKRRIQEVTGKPTHIA